MAPLDRHACLLCKGPTTPCYLVSDNSSNHLDGCHGMEKTIIGTSRHHCALQARVCIDCGFVAMFAANPAVFTAEAARLANREAPDLVPADSGGRGDEVASADTLPEDL